MLGGPDADTGLTGRKLMVWTSYGPFVPHGGGAFSGKDATKVDRSGAYMARYIAKTSWRRSLRKDARSRLPMPLARRSRVMSGGGHLWYGHSVCG